MHAPPELDRVMAFLSEAFRNPEPLPGDAALEERCAEHVTGNSRLSPAEQMDIYRRQYWLRHVDSLTEDYAGMKYLMGEDAFEAFARAYLIAHPPRHPSLRDLGADIVRFAEGYPDFPEETRAALLAMIRYENTLIDVFDGPDAPPLDPAKLTSLPEDAWERARIVLHPLLRRARLSYPVHRLRLRAREAGAPIDPPPEEAPTHLVIFRQDNLIRFEELEPLAFELLDALARGEPLVSACEEIARSLTPAEAESLNGKVGPWFQQWTARSWIVDVIV